jgi:hypothetical protein
MDEDRFWSAGRSFLKSIDTEKAAIAHARSIVPLHFAIGSKYRANKRNLGEIVQLGCHDFTITTTLVDASEEYNPANQKYDGLVFEGSRSDFHETWLMLPKILIKAYDALIFITPNQTQTVPDYRLGDKIRQYMCF